MLKIIEIIGEDDIRDLDTETIYFLNSILNKMNLKKIRNILLESNCFLFIKLQLLDYNNLIIYPY